MIGAAGPATVDIGTGEGTGTVGITYLLSNGCIAMPAKEGPNFSAMRLRTVSWHLVTGFAK